MRCRSDCTDVSRSSHIVTGREVSACNRSPKASPAPRGPLVSVEEKGRPSTTDVTPFPRDAGEGGDVLPVPSLRIGGGAARQSEGIGYGHPDPAAAVIQPENPPPVTSSPMMRVYVPPAAIVNRRIDEPVPSGMTVRYGWSFRGTRGRRGERNDRADRGGVGQTAVGPIRAVREAASRAMDRTLAKRSVEEFRSRIRGGSVEEKLRAIYAAAELGGSEGISLLLEALSDQTRRSAGWPCVRCPRTPRRE